jgi:hypothetical protein
LVRGILADPAWDEVDQWIRYRALGVLRDRGARKDLELLQRLVNDENRHVANQAGHARQILEQRLEREERMANDQRNRVVPDVPSEEAYRKKIQSLGDADWKKKDPHADELTWFRIDGGMAVADEESRRVRTFTNLFGFQDVEVRGIAFSAERVWLATNRGLMAYQRESHFWSRFAPTTGALDWPVTELKVGKDGALSVVFRAPEGERRYLFDPQREGWEGLE